MKMQMRSLALISLAVVAACAKHSGDIAGLQLGSPPRFETRVEIATGSNIHSDFHVADFDGDGTLDMAVISLTGELRILVGNGTNFVIGQELQIGGLPIWMSGGDLDEDGDEDLVIVRSAANTTDIWLNDGNGGFTQHSTLPVGTDALAIVVGDIDNDGNLDVAVSLPAAPQIVMAFGDGLGGLPGIQLLSLPNGGSAFNLAIGDVTRDGLNDLIVTDPDQDRVIVYTITPGKGGLNIDFCQLAVAGAPAAVALGDLSGDGLVDMAVTAFATNQYVVITQILPPVDESSSGGGGGTFCDYQSFAIQVPARPSIATIADVTGDGLPDLVACLAFSANMCIVPQLPGGGTGELFTMDSSGLPLRPFVGDFDKNGKNDVFALSGNGNRVNLWFARDSGALAGARNYASGLPGASWIEGADFDGDGDFEVATASNADSHITLLGRRSDGVLEVQFTIDVGLPVFQIESADLDFDGRSDLVVGVPGGIKLLRNLSSSGSYAFEVLPDVLTSIGSGNYPFGIAVGDFNRDGDLDIAVCDYVGGGVHVLPGTETPFVFGAEGVIQVGGGPVDVVAADFTGDGLVDLAVSRANQSDIAILRNVGEAGFVQFVTVPVGDMPNYLVTADFNRDGRADLVVSNASSGTVTVLFGTANGFSGQTYPAGSAPTALLAKDLTGDGFVDILVASLQSGDFRVLVGDGRGSFPLLPSFPGTLGASDAVLQDMDGDSRPDLLIASLVTNRVSLVRNIRD